MSNVRAPARRREPRWARRWAAIAGVAGLAVAGCGDGGSVADAFVVRDSAGITVAANLVAPEASDAVLRFRVDPDPAWPATLFGRVEDLALLDDGGLAVLDAQAAHVVVFDATGEVTRVLGGPGEGPGELSTLASSLVTAGDTIRVSDWQQDRWAVYLADGTVLPTEPLPLEPPERSWWLEGPDGDLWARSIRMIRGDDGRWTSLDRLFRMGSGSIDTVVTFAYRRSDLGGPGAAKVPLAVNAPMWAPLADGSVIWASYDDHTLRLLDSSGAIRRIVSAPDWRRRTTTASDLEVLLTKMGERLEQLGGSAEILDALPVVQPDSLPAFTSIRSDGESRIWVQLGGAVSHIHPAALNNPDPPAAWGGPEWDILDRDGRRLARVRFPPSFRMLDLDRTGVAGVVVNELGEESIAVFAVPGFAPSAR